MRAKRIIILNGSPRKEGNTARILEECSKAIEARGVEARIISLAGKNIASCKACYSCRETGRCTIDDELNSIADEI